LKSSLGAWKPVVAVPLRSSNDNSSVNVVALAEIWIPSPCLVTLRSRLLAIALLPNENQAKDAVVITIAERRSIVIAAKNARFF
jgi:hypothetical protein